jgi:uncharacterized protein
MINGLTQNESDLIIGIFKNFKNVGKAILFGSRAMGNYQSNSDIDIAIYNYGSLMESELIELELEELPLPYKFDLKDVSSIKNKALQEHINRVGIVIYEKKS